MATWKTAARPNAGRRKKRGRAFVPPTVGHPGPADWLLMSRDELVEMRSPDAVAELFRRGRDADGVKLAWKTPKAQARAAANPDRPPRKIRSGVDRYRAFRDEMKKEGMSPAEINALWKARKGRSNPAQPHYSWARLRGGRFFFDPALPKDFGEIYILQEYERDRQSPLTDFTALSPEGNPIHVFQEAGHKSRTVFIGEVLPTHEGRDVKVLGAKRYMLPERTKLMAQTEKMIAEALVAVRKFSS